MATGLSIFLRVVSTHAVSERSSKIASGIAFPIEDRIASLIHFSAQGEDYEHGVANS